MRKRRAISAKGAPRVSGRRTRPHRSRLVLIVVAAALGVLLTSCQPPFQPMTYDITTRTGTTDAEWRVAPITTQRGPGIDIRMRGCQSMILSGTGTSDDGQTDPLSPVARIIDATGQVWLVGKGAQSWAYLESAFDGTAKTPTGAWVDDTRRWDQVDRLVVPVAGMRAPLSIEAGCFAGNSRVYEGFLFQACTTAKRSCPTSNAGSFRVCYFCISGP